MSLPPSISQLSPTALGDALRTLPYRQAALLSHWLLQGRTREECARLYGISPEACAIHLLRASLALTRSLALPVRLPADDDEEAVWALAFTGTLEREQAGAPSAFASTVTLCRRLREQGPALSAAIEAAEHAEAHSPRRRRGELLRRLAVLALLVLTALLYWSRSEESPTPPLLPPPTGR